MGTFMEHRIMSPRHQRMRTHAPPTCAGQTGGRGGAGVDDVRDSASAVEVPRIDGRRGPQVPRSTGRDRSLDLDRIDACPVPQDLDEVDLGNLGDKGPRRSTSTTRDVEDRPQVDEGPRRSTSTTQASPRTSRTVEGRSRSRTVDLDDEGPSRDLDLVPQVDEGPRRRGTRDGRPRRSPDATGGPVDVTGPPGLSRVELVS
jgi:hypothetical protein